MREGKPGREDPRSLRIEGGARPCGVRRYPRPDVEGRAGSRAGAEASGCDVAEKSFPRKADTSSGRVMRPPDPPPEFASRDPASVTRSTITPLYRNVDPSDSSPGTTEHRAPPTPPGARTRVTPPPPEARTRVASRRPAQTAGGPGRPCLVSAPDPVPSCSSPPGTHPCPDRRRDRPNHPDRWRRKPVHVARLYNGFWSPCAR